MGTLWTETQLSAYLDAQLPAAERVALEADLARDAALQEQMAALRHTVAMVRALPLREPPRNYLLTPAMVAAPTPPQPTRARRSLLPLWLMRAATALSAAAFVLAVGLNLNPAMLPMARAPMETASETAFLMDAPEEPVMLQAMPEAEAPADASAAMKSAPPDAAAPAPEFGVGGGFEEGNAGAPGVGGVGGGEPEVGLAAAPFPTPEATAGLGLCAEDNGEDCAETAGAAMLLAEPEMLSETTATEPEVARLVEPEVSQTMSAPDMTLETTAAPLPQPGAPIPLWLVGLLGASTVGLGWGTWHLSRRR